MNINIHFKTSFREILQHFRRQKPLMSITNLFRLFEPYSLQSINQSINQLGSGSVLFFTGQGLVRFGFVHIIFVFGFGFGSCQNLVPVRFVLAGFVFFPISTFWYRYPTGSAVPPHGIGLLANGNQSSNAV